MSVAHVTSGKTSKAKLRLIEAALESLMEDGIDGCSVRKICERAGVATGLINYHYPSIHHLVADAYRHLALTFLNNAIESSAHYANHPRQQMSAFLGEIFSAQVMQRKVLRAWLVFWGLIDSTPAVQTAHKASHRSFCDHLESIFIALEAQKKGRIKPRMAAVGLSAMIDGLWLEWCLQTDSFNPADCIALCEHWVDSVVS